MDVREKLVELIRCADYHPCGGSVRKIGSMFTTEFIEDIASQLIDNGVTVQEWVPVTERLPESGEWVLCACRANIIEVLKYDSTMDDWDSTMPERCYMNGFVTHWMPLPQLPKGD